MQKESGVTLLELILVVVMISILAGFVSSMIYNEINTYQIVTSRSEVIQNLQRTTQFMSKELREIMNPDSIFQASTDSIRFDKWGDIPISYKLVDGQLFRNNAILIPSVNMFSFTYYDNSGNQLASPVANPDKIKSIELKIIKILKGQPITLNTKVTPRNFLQ